MEKVGLSEIECSSSTKINSHYHQTNNTNNKSSHTSSSSSSKSSQVHNSSNRSHNNSHNHEGNSYGSGRQNQVSNVLLFGIPIVALIMDGKERLCLAQISSTLLKEFSYNEIHNRRVALGINCIQCTPVQLEILRRAGAMPVTSRRCGMITKREAERLCQSFLGDHAPPQLPENFAFDVFHECAWGCRGSFVPSRYNSSRAKCIRCVFCQLFFSPNKFIFHSHRLPTSRYVQPDAANFNSWRRHLKLYNTACKEASMIAGSSGIIDVDSSNNSELIGSSTATSTSIDSSGSVLTDNAISSSDNGRGSSPITLALASTPEIVHAWEDVKAMFNGGTRKRLLAVHSIPATGTPPPLSSSAKQQQQHEKHLRKNSAVSKRGNHSNNPNNSGVNNFATNLQLQQQQARQSCFLQHPTNAPSSHSVTNLNHQHQFTTATSSVSQQQHHQAASSIWNPGISSNDTNIQSESHNTANTVSSNATINEIINAAAVAAAAAAAASSSAHHHHQQQQHPPILHPTGISSVLSNPFNPWFHRSSNFLGVGPPLFPFSHPFGPTCKYLNSSSSNNEASLEFNQAGKNSSTSAFKPIIVPTAIPPSILLASTEPRRIGTGIQHQQQPLQIPGIPLVSPTTTMDYSFLRTSSSSVPWLTTSNVRNNGSPEDLSLNSGGGILVSSSPSVSSPSSSTSSSFSSSGRHHTFQSSDDKIVRSEHYKEEKISPTTCEIPQENLSSKNWNKTSEEEPSKIGICSDDESSDIDITDDSDDDNDDEEDRQFSYLNTNQEDSHNIRKRNRSGNNNNTCSSNNNHKSTISSTNIIGNATATTKVKKPKLLMYN